MSKCIDFYYDFLSPYAYLAFSQLPSFARRTGAEVIFKPVEVLKVMARVGNSPTTILCAPKGRYAVADLARWASAYGIPLNRNPHHRSIAARPLLLGAVAAAKQGRIEAYSRAVFDGVWVKQAAFADDTEMLDVLRQSGFEDADAVLAGRSEAGAELDALVDEAVSAGVFGVPSFTIAGKLFFGNDRLNFLEQALRA